MKLFKFVSFKFRKQKWHQKTGAIIILSLGLKQKNVYEFSENTLSTKNHKIYYIKIVLSIF